MSARLIKYGFFLVFFFNTLNIAYSQVLNNGNNNGNNNYNSIEAKFVKENIQIEPREAFFNVLQIINTSEQNRFVNLKFETPIGWSLITDTEQRVNLSPLDTVFVPLRASANRSVKGEIGYSIVASLSSRSGNPITTAYCFIKVPRNSDLRFRPLTRVSYIDQKTSKGSFSFLIENDGNIDEVVNLQFSTSSSIRMKDEVNNEFNTDLLVPARTDTIISFDVAEINGEVERGLNKVQLNASSENYSFGTTFWFRKLSNTYKHTKPNSEIPLIVGLNLQNFFSQYGSNFTGSLAGNVLLKNDRDISYDFYQYNRQDVSLWKSSRMYFRYNDPKLTVEAGDRVNFVSRFGLGRGILIDYNVFNKTFLGVKYSKNLYYPIDNYGINFKSLKSKYTINGTFELSRDHERNLNTLFGVWGGNLNFFKNHKISADVGFSDTYDKKVTNPENFGYYSKLRYEGNIDKVRIRLKNRYSSDGFFGKLAGRNRIFANVNYPYKNNFYFNLYVKDYSYKRINYFNEVENTDKKSISRSIGLNTNKKFSTDFNTFVEPIYSYYKSNLFYSSDDASDFISNTPQLKIGTRLKIDNFKTISTSLTSGYTFIDQYEQSNRPDVLETREEFFNAVFNLSYYTKDWGAFFRYYYGPYNGNQYFTYFYRGEFRQIIRLMPYYRSYLYKDVIELDSRLNYMFSIFDRTHRMNFGNQLRFYFDYGIILNLIGNFTFQASLGEEEQISDAGSETYTYSNTYFELRLKKQFGWNQPRVSYYNLNVNLYKDLNGNLKKDYNEPGVKDILVHIEKLDPSKIDTIETDYEYTGSLARNRLLSGMKGNVSYQNIEQGVYKINLQNVGKAAGKFSADQQEFIVNMNQDREINVPFLERNKIFGKIVLNRSKLSNLGNVSVQNIKITAEDTKGRKISTLTDRSGSFVLYAPSVDLYTVSINNVFRDHFDLRKNNYKVQLNGYKQFEVNFIFDEKRRQINFTPSFTEEDVEVQSVKRTNLTGTVKDENTLQPVRATLEVVDNTSGSTVETTHSDRNSGRFSMSFMTGANYSLIVTAPGYWFYSEKLNLDQMLTIQDVEKDVLLRNIIIGSKIELNNLQFAPGSTEIPNNAYPELDRLIEQLKQNPNVRIQISGHSDALETLDNPDLSVNRAKAVSKYMMQNGFSNIEYVGYKDKKPIAPNDTEENRAKNRRVEVLVVDK